MEEIVGTGVTRRGGKGHSASSGDSLTEEGQILTPRLRRAQGLRAEQSRGNGVPEVPVVGKDLAKFMVP